MYRLKYRETKMNDMIYMYHNRAQVLIQPIYCDTIQSPNMNTAHFP